MSNTLLSPNMNIPYPVVGQDPGPQYGTDQNSGVLVIDSHDHTPGHGVPIPLSALGGGPLTADLNFGSAFGLIAGYYKSASNNISQSGELRLSNTDFIGFRNHNNNADVTLGMDGSTSNWLQVNTGFRVNGAQLAMDVKDTSPIGSGAGPGFQISDLNQFQAFWGFDSRNDGRLRSIFNGGTAAAPGVKAWMLNQNTYGGDFWNLPLKCNSATGDLTSGSPLITNVSPAFIATLNDADLLFSQIQIAELVTARGANTFTTSAGQLYVTTGGQVFDTSNQTTYTYTAYNRATGVFTGVTPDPASAMSVNDHLYTSVGIPLYATVASVSGTTITMSLNANASMTGMTFYSSVNQFGHLTMASPGTRCAADSSLLNLYGATNVTSTIGAGPHLMLHNNDPLHTPGRLCSLVVMNDDYQTGGVPIGGIDWKILGDGTNGTSGQSGSGYMYTFNAGAGVSFFTWDQHGSLSLGAASETISLKGPVLLADGVAGTPAWAFTSSANTGAYLSGGALRFSYHGTEQFQIGSGGLSASNGQIGILDGSLAAPGLAFVNEQGTGIYRQGSANLRLGVTGTLVMILSPSVVAFNQQIQNANATFESTGAGSALLGGNCPASTLTAPFKWIKILTSDGSTAYIPAWK